RVRERQRDLRVRVGLLQSLDDLGRALLDRRLAGERLLPRSHAQRPSNRGARRSSNARTPSARSALAYASLAIASNSAIWSGSRSRSSDNRRTTVSLPRLNARVVSGAPAAIVS